MLRLLLDEHIAPAVAAGLRRRCSGLAVWALREWQGGVLLGQPDAVCLDAAWEAGLTLVSYDVRTIAPLLQQWAAESRSHAGVVFVDGRTIAPGNTEALTRSLEALVKAGAEWEWRDRVTFLQR